MLTNKDSRRRPSKIPVRLRSPPPKSSSLPRPRLPAAMAQNGPHGHQVGATASDDGHSAPPTTVAFSLTSAGPYGNAGSSAGNMENMDASAGKGKNLIPDLNMEDRDSAGGSKDNKPRSEAEAVEVAAADADADAKVKSVAAAEDGEPNVKIALERERRKRMKDLFRALQDVMPHVPQKVILKLSHDAINRTNFFFRIYVG